MEQELLGQPEGEEVPKRASKNEHIRMPLLKKIPEKRTETYSAELVVLEGGNRILAFDNYDKRLS